VAVQARDLRRAPRRSGARPDLRVARPDLQVARRPTRQRRTGVRLAACVLALFLALFGNAVAHSVLVSGQERLDGLNTQLEQQQAENQRLHLRAAALESPNRIVEAAKDLGMEQPAQTEWLAPDQDGGVASTTDSSGGGSTPAGDAGTEELAGGGEGDATDVAGR
jgi:cell division protein FtsB